LERFERKRAGIQEIRDLMNGRRITRDDIVADPDLAPHAGESVAAALRDPAHRDCLGALMPNLPDRFPQGWIETVELDARYAGYEEKEERLAGRMERSERLRIPERFDFRAVRGLSTEAATRLSEARPLTLGQASRVRGVRSSDAALLLIALTRRP
jgi:tRNA uridine 5-carboxymethylaminomethyl modification enzyme